MLHDSTLQGKIAWFCFTSVNIFGNANKTTVFDADSFLKIFLKQIVLPQRVREHEQN